MAILIKAGDAYAAVDTIYHKAAGVYSPVEGVFCKNAGAYESIGGGGGGGALAGAVAIFKSSNYSSGQVWANEVAAPADGSLQTDHDWWLGTDSTVDGFDPTYTAGTPGYFVGNGKRFTQAKDAVANVVDFYRNLHHAGTKFSILVKLRWTLQLSGDIIPIFDSGAGDFGGSYTGRGVVFGDLSGARGNPAGRLNLNVLRDSGGTASKWVYSNTQVPDDTDIVIGVSFDGTGAAASFFYLNGEYFPVNGGTDTFDGTLDTPGTSQTGVRPALAARADNAGSKLNFARFYSFAIFNTNLTLEQMIAADAAINV